MSYDLICGVRLNILYVRKYFVLRSQFLTALAFDHNLLISASILSLHCKLQYLSPQLRTPFSDTSYRLNT